MRKRMLQLGTLLAVCWQRGIISETDGIPCKKELGRYGSNIPWNKKAGKLHIFEEI